MTAAPIPYFVVDAFADRPFSGNPAAVCLLNEWPEDAWLQAVAGEMNLSETAFLVKKGEGFHLRWFTPRVEVDLCGHATLASAHVLWQQGLATPEQPIQFSSRSGVLKAALRSEEIELDFPLDPEQSAEAPAHLLAAMGITPRYIGKSRFDYLIEVESENVLRHLKPDFKLLAAVPCRGIIATSRSSDERFDFVSRFFAPAAGIDEDPVTGSAHCCLGEFWRKRLGKSEFLAYQASARGGVVRVRVTDTRALLAGRAMTMASGQLSAMASPAEEKNPDEYEGSLMIRSYVNADESQVVALWRDVFPDNPPWNDPVADIRRKLGVQRELFLIARWQGRVVGSVMAGFDGHRGWVHLVAVALDCRQRGLGRSLMEEAEQRLRQIGCTKINLQVRSTNDQVVAFYQRLGYTVEDRVSMGKRIDDKVTR